MKRNMSAFLLLTLLTLALIAPVVAFNLSAKMDPLLKDKVKILELPMGKPSEKPTAPRLSVEITYPADGATLALGEITISVAASARTGIEKVEIKIDEGNWLPMDEDSGVYKYLWDASTAEGTYVLTAKATDLGGKTATDTNTVNIGSTPPPPPETGKWAVVIGIADYQGRGNDLWHPDEDAKEMAKVLYENGYPAENVKVLLNRQATANAIVAAINWLVVNAEADDEVVFFYSGHGTNVSEVNDLSYTNWDGDNEADQVDEAIVSYDFYGIVDGDLRSAFASVKSTKFALMFGSCFSGGMNDLQGPGRVIVTACAEDQLGWDYLTLGNTLWGYYFVDRGLLNNPDIASVEEAHAYAYPLVTAVHYDSEPQLYDNYLGDFVL